MKRLLFVLALALTVFVLTPVADAQPHLPSMDCSVVCPQATDGPTYCSAWCGGTYKILSCDQYRNQCGGWPYRAHRCSSKH